MKYWRIALGIALLVLAGPRPVFAQQTDGESDCIWDCVLVQYWPGGPWHWKCVDGDVGMDCQYGAGYCSYINCDSFAMLDAAGGLKQLSVCKADVPALVGYSRAAGLEILLQESLRTGRVVIDDRTGDSGSGSGSHSSHAPRP